MTEPGFTPLRIARADWAAEGIRRFELRAPDGGPLPPFPPGAHVKVQVPSGVIRNYSLANAWEEDPGLYEIAVKREAEGRGGSVSLCDRAAEGDLIPVSEPANDVPLSEKAASFLFIAGGIGITPILSMVRHLAASGDARPFRLIYLTRSPQVTAYRQALARFGKAVTIHHDQGDPDRALDLWPLLETQKRGCHLYCCGPSGLMQAVRDMSGHWQPGSVHFEDFGTANTRPRPEDSPFTVRLARRGAAFEVPVGTSILEVLRAHGIRVPSSCESGTCGSCRTRWLAGEPDHRDLVLSPAERDREMMICVGRAKGELVLDL
jgi:phthalate 4,5-dioxygenase reductase subunit